jgi:serpin B
MKKRTIVLFLMTVLCVIFIGCRSNSGDSEPVSDFEPVPDVEAIPDAEPVQLKLVEKVSTDNMFALNLFRTACQFSDPEENVFISPLSVSMALSMVLNGAEKNTKDEMLAVLCSENYSMEDINEYNRSLRTALMKIDPSTEFSIANSIWYRQDLSVEKSFIDVNRNNYDAEVNKIDFSSPSAANQINSWCAQKTNYKITKIVDRIDNKEKMYLINAIYFKGIWKSEFDESSTDEKDFHLSNGEIQKVDMMYQSGRFNYTRDKNAAYLELPYGNKAFSMIVILPHEGKTEKEITAQLNALHWNNIMGQLSVEKVNLWLPRFKTECKYALQKEILPNVGMKIPFSNLADFSGISDTSLKISAVIQKTYVEVNEKGTEAAAVTAVSMSNRDSGNKWEPSINFIVDKPFLFVICEKSTGVILFIGRINRVMN